MTYKNIYEYFEGDDLLSYYDPTSKVKTHEGAVMDIYQKLVEHSKERKCEFVRDEIGYIFHSSDLLISFCVRKECRDKENLAYFGNLIKSKLEPHFDCFLFTKNKKAIGFLERIGMKKEEENHLITLLRI